MVIAPSRGHHVPEAPGTESGHAILLKVTALLEFPENLYFICCLFNNAVSSSD
jgi:hypothetical protein